MFSSPPKPVAPPPVPTIDDTGQNQAEADKILRRGQATTLLTGSGGNGLPNLGAVSQVSAGGMPGRS